MGGSVRVREIMKSKMPLAHPGFMLWSFGKDNANSVNTQEQMKESRVKTVYVQYYVQEMKTKRLRTEAKLHLRSKITDC